MGLAICVGMLADLLEGDAEGAEYLEGELAVANRVLAAAGLPPHAEPRDPMRFDSRASLGGFPYSFIHYLRRAYAHRMASPHWVATPVPDGTDPAHDPEILNQFDTLDSHLLCHSDAEGFYLPIEFDEVLFAQDDTASLPGGMLGSSQRLMEELVRVAPALGITLNDGQLSDEEAGRVDELVHHDDGLYREYAAWLLLYESARLSIAHRTAIVFC